jgi:RHS repeat-associated protein
MTSRYRVSFWSGLLTAVFLSLMNIPEIAGAAAGDGPAADSGVMDNSGANKLFVPIPLPPATGGFAPNLLLSYSNDRGDGPFGVGWDLQFGEIARSSRFGIPSMSDPNDVFELDGQVLVPNPIASTPTRTRYHTFTESFARILHIVEGGQDSWEVTRPDGTILRFGIDSTSRVLRDGTSGPIARWLLREMESPDGNVLLFDHLIEMGAAYPQRARFSYRDTPRAPVGSVRQVEFVYETRPDPTFIFTGGVPQNLTRRVSEIVVTVGSTTFRRMQLVYSGEAGAGTPYSTGLSRLASVQMFGVGGTESLPAQRFEYSDHADAIGTGSNWATDAFALPTDRTLIGPAGEDRGVRFGDINGDGRVDLLRAYQAASGDISQRVYLNTGTGWDHSTSWSGAVPTQLNGKKIRYTMQQSGGQLLLTSVTVSSTNDANPVIFASEKYPKFEQPGSDPLTLEYVPAQSWILADINGDGRADLVGGYTIATAGPACSSLMPTTKVQEVWINSGTDWDRQTDLSAALPPPRSIALACTVSSNPQSAISVSPMAKLAELDGNARSDLIFPGTNNQLANAGRVFRQQASGWSESVGQQQLFSEASVVEDVNRDGLADVLVGTDAGDRTVYLNTGTGWCASSQASDCGDFADRYALPTSVGQSRAYSDLHLTDLNGDGWLDVLRQNQANPTAAGSAWLYDISAPGGSVWVADSRFAPPKAAAVVDLDFDGAPDLGDLAHGQDYGGISRFSDLLTGFENGLGGTIAYAYESAAKQQDADFNEVTDLSTGTFKGFAVWTTSPVLASRSFSGVDVVPFTQTYLYAQPQVLTEWRMSQGFAGVQAIDPDDTITVSYFAGVAGVSGRLLSRNVTSSLDAQPYSNEVFEYDVFAGDDPNVGPGSTADARVGRLRRRISSNGYGLPTSPLLGATLTEAYEYGLQPGDSYNGYGFVTKSTITRSTETVVTRRKLNAPDLARWIVDLPQEILVTMGSTEISKLRFEYGTSGHPTAITAYEGPRGNLAAATARTTNRTYDAFGNLRSETDPGGRLTEFCYDGDSTFASSNSCNSPTSEVTHSVRIGVRDPLGQVVTEAPDPVTGDITEALRVYSGDRDKQEYDAFGRVTEVSTQPAGQSDIVLAQATYVDVEASPIDQAFTETFAAIQSGSAESVRRAVYADGFGREVRTVSDGPKVDGQSRYFGVATRIDAALRQVTKTYPAACGSGGTDPHCSGLFTGSQPRAVQVTDPLGRTLSVTTPDGLSRFYYASASRSHPDTGSKRFDIVLAADAAGHLVRRWFDGQQLIFVEECTTGPVGPTTNLADQNCAEDAVTFYRYEPGGQLADLYGAHSNNWNDPSKATLRSVFDSLGRVVEQYDLNKNAGVLSAYDAAGNKQTETNARGQQIQFVYDALSRPTQITYPSALGTRRYTMTYDNDTRAIASVEQTQTAPTSSTLSLEQFSYDALGRRVRESLQVGTRAAVVSEIDQDLLGRITQIRTPDLSTTLGYEYEGAYLRRVCELGSATSCTSSGTQAYLSSIEYDVIGRETGLVGPVPSGAPAPRLDASYNASTYRLNRLNFIPTQGTGAERLDLTYTYDPRGSVASIADGSINSGTSDVPYGVTYTYDRRNRISKRTRGSETKHFTYNDFGNLTGKNVNSSGGTNQSYDSVKRHRIVSGGGLTYGYDADGNVTARGSQRFVYDALQRLECIGTTTSTCPEPYLYGLDGIRIASDGGTTPPRVFAGDLFEWEPATGAGTVRVYALGRQVAYKRIPTVTLRTGVEWIGMPLERLVPRVLILLALLACAGILVLLLRAGLIEGLQARSAFGSVAALLILMLCAPPSLVVAATLPTNQGVYRRWVWEDRLGSGVHITDEQGVMKHQRSFEPFGEIAKESSSEITERTFAGHSFEDNPGLYYMNARWYDPAVGRFHSVDPVVRSISTPESLNAYSYVENNPTSRVDPSGACFLPCDDGGFSFSFTFGSSFSPYLIAFYQFGVATVFRFLPRGGKVFGGNLPSPLPNGGAGMSSVLSVAGATVDREGRFVRLARAILKAAAVGKLIRILADLAKETDLEPSEVADRRVFSLAHSFISARHPELLKPLKEVRFVEIPQTLPTEANPNPEIIAGQALRGGIVELDPRFYSADVYFHELIHLQGGRFGGPLLQIDDWIGGPFGLHDAVKARAEVIYKEFQGFLRELNP